MDHNSVLSQTNHIKFNYLNIEKKECLHTSFYCEENVWKLCEMVQKQGKSLDTLDVVFISNDQKQILLWMQTLGQPQNGHLICWDYHVFLICHKNGHKSVVYDLDSILPFPTLFDDYLNLAIRPIDVKEAQFKPFFRVIPASLFLQKFASDRREMKKSDGTWLKDPPPWPCISTPEGVNNLQELIAMNNEKCDIGQIMDIDQFSNQFLAHS